MSRNVNKTSKRPSYHLQANYSSQTTSQQHFANHLSLDLSKEKDLVTIPKEISQHATSPQTNLKKLGFLLDNRKDKSLAAQVMAGNSVHISPKNFVEVSKKFNKPKTPSNSSSIVNKSSEFNLISPKDLVRKAMSKIKSKENVKQELSRSPSASKKVFPKSMTLSTNNGFNASEKRNETCKTITTTLEDHIYFSGSPKHDKAEKMMKLKKIYNDDLSRFMRLNTHSPSEDTRIILKQGSLTTSQSQTGLALPGSIVPTTKPSRAPSTTFSNPGEGERRKNSKSKIEKSHKKVGSIGQVDLFTKKECKSSMRQRTKSTGNKMPMADLKKSTIYSNLQRASPANLTQGNYYLHERPNSPVINNLEGGSITTVEEAPFDTEELLTDEGTLSVTNRDEKKIPSTILDGKKSNETKVNNYTQPQSDQLEYETVELAAEDHVQHAKSTLLEKMRDMLGSKEFVKREEYERILRERIELEEELHNVKDENIKLRGFFMHLQNTGLLTDSHQELREIISRQQKELQMLRKREEAVRNVFQMIKKTGVALDEFTTTEENESLYTEQDFISKSSEEKVKPLVNVYAMPPKNKEFYGSSIINQARVVQTEVSLQESQYSKDINELPITDKDIEETMLEVKSGSENKASDDDNSIFSAQVKKSNIAEAKSTADSSPIFSANAMSAHSLMKAKLNGKFNLDLTKVGGANILTVKSNEASSQTSSEKLINQYIITNGGL